MSWFMPSWGRPHKLMSMLDAPGEWPPEVIVQVNEDDPALPQYCENATPPWHLEIVPSGLRCSDIHRLTYERHPHENFYGFLMDDLWPVTKDWWRLLIQAAGEMYFAIPQGPGYPKSIRGAFVMGGELVRTMGCVVPVPTRHWCEDCIWDDIANTMGLMRPVKRALVDHHNFEMGRAPNDATYMRSRDFLPHDEEQFQKWLRSEGRPALFARIQSKLKEAA